MDFDADSINTESVAGQIAKLIRASILDGRLAVNERLPTEVELSTRFGVSRPTVREALKRLAAQNLIRSQRGPSGGNFVSMPSTEHAKAELASTTTMLLSIGEVPVMDLFEAREKLESVCVRLAAERRSDAQLEALARSIAEQEREDLTDVKFCAADVSFHRTLTEAAGNKMLEFLMAAIVEAVQPVSNMMVFRVRDRREIVRHHKGLLARLAESDAEGAVAVLLQQMAYLRVHYERAHQERHAKLARKKKAAVSGLSAALAAAPAEDGSGLLEPTAPVTA